jgi:hypothetical protein
LISSFNHSSVYCDRIGMVRNEDRLPFVRGLNVVARSLDLQTVPDGSARARVKLMVEAIFASPNIEASTLEDAKAKWAAYLATFSRLENQASNSASVASGSSEAVEVGGEPTQATAEEPAIVADTAAGKEWNFRALQLTYNGSGGAWVSTDRNVLFEFFTKFTRFLYAMAEGLGGSLGISATMEESLKATEPRVHLHAYIHLRRCYHKRGQDALDPFIFESRKPHVEPNQGRGRAFKGAVNYGHFYVVANKKGSLFWWANVLPFVDYLVEGWRLDNSMKAGKLEHSVYLDYAAGVCIGFQRRLADVRAVQRYRREGAAEAAAAEEEACLAGMLQPIKHFAEVDAFVELFDGAARHRRPILVIAGGTNLGKSLLAAEVLCRIGHKLRTPGYLEVTIEDAAHLDLADFDRDKHSGVLLDGVGDAAILKHHREVLQGRPKVAKGARSATMMYAYLYTLCNRAVVATMDLSAKNLDMFVTDHWLSNAHDVKFLMLQEKAYEPSADDVPMPAFI